jgi:UDP-N-acetylmuramate dehydrogenase
VLPRLVWTAIDRVVSLPEMSATLPTSHCPLPTGLDAEVRADEPMARHTSFRIGGAADWWVRPRTVAALEAVVAACNGRFTLLGKGSNVLVRDGGVRGVVINLGLLDDFAVARDRIVVGAGLPLGRLLVGMRRHGFGGLEDLAGVPGTIGAAVRMNAGAHDDCMADLLLAARVLDSRGRLVWRDADGLGLRYRGSDLAPDEVVVEAVLRVRPARPAPRQRARERLAAKRATQPLDRPNAGSIFKNPPGHSAWRLIRDAGLAGARQGQAEISAKHANFIVNLGGARAADVEALINRTRSVVLARTGIALELEIQILGEKRRDAGTRRSGT